MAGLRVLGCADYHRQNALYPVSHYFDVAKTCRICRRRVIFYAREQKFWYEDLRFPQHANCVHCHDCRREQRYLKRLRLQYERLITDTHRTESESLDLAECTLELIRLKAVKAQKIDLVRMVIKRTKETPKNRKRLNALTDKAATI